MKITLKKWSFICDNGVPVSPPKKMFFWQPLFKSSLGRIMLKSQGLCHGGGGGVPLFLANFPNGLLFRLPRRPLMVRAALLRRSCDGVAACDGDAQTSSVALILRVASATQLMLLRRS